MYQQLTPEVILGVVILYFIILLGISYLTSKDSSNEQFFLAGRKSPWYLVAFGMIGASLSGVTFISIPGVVGASGLNQAFSYMQVVFGYLLGYLFIALVLLPLYYRLQLTSIYTYLERRFGFYSYKTGAAYFLLSRTIGAAFRLYLVAIVLQSFVMGPLLRPYGIAFPFWLTVAITIVLIWIYTFRAGIRTIVWTDSLQTLAMLLALILTIFSISHALELSFTGMVNSLNNSGYTQVFFFENGWSDPNNFFKQFLSGALICTVMTGLDQDMMQKNLSCPNLWDAQKNMLTFSLTLVAVNFLFLTLGAMLYVYAAQVGIAVPERTDELFPLIALGHLSPVVGIFFVLGLIAAAYSSADSALTSLTTSFCVDFLGFEKKQQPSENHRSLRYRVHVGFSLLLFVVILLFNALSNDAVISELFRAAGYTYGPLLGLFAFGLFTRLQINDRWVIPVCVAGPVISFFIDANSARWLNGFQFGFLILALNGLLTFLGLLAISYREYEAKPVDDEDMLA